MAIKVVQIGTGNVGRHALTQLINDPRFELTGVWVSSQSKAGKDAAELAGLDNPTGIIATNDLDAILNDKPECAVYTAMADNRLPDELVKPIEEATTTGQSSTSAVVSSSRKRIGATPR